MRPLFSSSKIVEIVDFFFFGRVMDSKCLRLTVPGTYDVVSEWEQKQESKKQSKKM